MKKYYILAANSDGTAYFAKTIYGNHGMDVPVGYDTHEEAIEASKAVLRQYRYEKVYIFKAAVEVAPKTEVEVITCDE